MVKEYGYEYDAGLDELLASATAGKCVRELDCGAFLLRSGRDALKTVAREYDGCLALLPSLACDSMVLPFSMYGHQVVYYRLHKDYSIDLDSVLQAIRGERRTVLFLYAAYFGNRCVTDVQLELLKRECPNMIFLEDRTHDLIYFGQNAFMADYTVASLRKWTWVPDGGLLWARRALKCTDFDESTDFSETRRRAQCLRREYFQTGEEALKTEYRKIFSTVTDRIDAQRLPGRMSMYAYELAKQTDWEELKQIREANAAVLIKQLKQVAQIKLIQAEGQRSNLYVPVLIEHRDEVQKRLSAKGIFTTLIWPLNETQKRECPTARYTEAHMLGIPCDQRYTEADMQLIGSEFIKALND